MSSYENRQDNIRDLVTPEIEVFRNIYSDKRFEVSLEIPEFTAICPKTGLPDFGTIYITYIPNEVCLELKSLKEYFLFYRNQGIFHENVVNKTLDDLCKITQPHYMKIKAKYYPRGGIYTDVEAEYKGSGY